jgi:aminopeptidase
VNYNGQKIEDIELWFENGKVVNEQASKNVDLLTKTLDTDEGTRYLNERWIGTNFIIQRITKHMLFGENIVGTLHLAVGSGYPEIVSNYKSVVHWDILCDMNHAEITVEGELFYKDAKFNI